MNQLILKDIFVEIAQAYSCDSFLINSFWEEIKEAYSNQDRYYHNLSHLENMIEQLCRVKKDILDWDTIIFSTFYHDIVYDVRSQKNEEDSADFAKERLQKLSYPSEKIDKCVSLILATKSHGETTDLDTRFFVDADLAILGQDWEAYLQYSQQVRKEYAIYSDSVYKAGRKDVLAQMLAMPRIFKTGYYYNELEKSARYNMAKEIDLLS